jgi:hypothetical protein
LSLEALDDRILPYASPFTAAAFPTNSLAANYGTSLQMVPPLSPLFTLDPAPILASLTPGSLKSSINLGLGNLAITLQNYNNAAGVWNFVGTFESTNQIPLLGFNVSDDVGQLSIFREPGQISRWPVSSGTAVFPNGITYSYYTNSISFQTSGSGNISHFGADDAQTVRFTGLVLSVWVNGQTVPVGVSGTLDIHDHVTNVFNPLTGMTLPGPFDFDTNAVVPGMMFLGTTWAAITH